MERETMSVDRALAVICTLIEPKASKRVLEVLLGRDEVPDAKEFTSVEIESKDRWRACLDVIGDAVGALRKDLDSRPEQGEFDFVDSLPEPSDAQLHEAGLDRDVSS